MNSGYMHHYVHRSPIYNGQNLERTQMSLNKFSQAAKVSELEKHLTELKATVHCDQDVQNPLSVGL